MEETIKSLQKERFDLAMENARSRNRICDLEIEIDLIKI